MADLPTDDYKFQTYLDSNDNNSEFEGISDLVLNRSENKRSSKGADMEINTRHPELFQWK
jgi:hypothetical protein